MKALAFFALSAVATAAMAAAPTTPATINISGTSTQTASVTGSSAVVNLATEGTYANQNLASNKGNVQILDGAKSEQTVRVHNGVMIKAALQAGDVAVQSASSNVGNVDVAGKQSQTTSVTGGMVNIANGNGCGDNCNPAETATAYQNASSNFGDVTIGANGKSTQKTSVAGLAVNVANGGDTVAVQNMSSNYGQVNIWGTSSQTTAIGAGSIVANLAWGDKAAAYQNLASNDSCEPPPPICVGAACGPFQTAQAGGGNGGWKPKR